MRSWGRGEQKGPAPPSWNTLESDAWRVVAGVLRAVSLIPQIEHRSLEAPETQPPGLLPFQGVFLINSLGLFRPPPPDSDKV